jgi:glucans biosynthesis protein C
LDGCWIIFSRMKKEASIETLRGLAIILMVAGHVVGGSNDVGMQVEDDSVYRYLYSSLRFLRMPLFTVISGYVYAFRPVFPTKEFKYLKGKARRVLLPMIFVSTLFFIVQYITPGTNTNEPFQNIWKIYIFSYAHFWFLQALFLVFIAITIIERFNLLSTVQNWLTMLFVAGLMLLYVPHTIEFFSFPNFLYLFPFFIFGIGLYRFSDILLTNRVVALGLALIFITGMSLVQLHWFGITVINLDKFGILSLTNGLSGIGLLFIFRRNIKFLAYLGSFAYSIYLFHVFGTAGARILLQKLNIADTGFMLFIISLVAGLLLPIIAEMVFSRINAFRLLFLGLRPIKKDSSRLDPVQENVRLNLSPAPPVLSKRD